MSKNTITVALILVAIFCGSVNANLRQNLTTASMALQKLDLHSARNALMMAQREATPRNQMLIKSALDLTEEAMQKGHGITAGDVRPALRALNGAIQTAQ